MNNSQQMSVTTELNVPTVKKIMVVDDDAFNI
jgi:hypothetical protein